MDIQTSQPPHLKKPLMVFCVGFLVYAILVTATFYLTSLWLSLTAEWRPYVAALPGIAMCGIFLLLYFYMKSHDELVRGIMTASLAASGVIGLAVHLVSMTRAEVGGYSEFDDATTVVIMALAFMVAASFLLWKHR